MSSKQSNVTWVTDRLAVGHAPMSHGELERLKAEGIDAIMNLCAEFCDLHEIQREAGFEVYYMPVVDEEAPEMKELEQALSWLDEAVYLGKKVLIHCRHGIGRTGTVLNAYLLRRGLGHKLAGRKLKNMRSKPANFEQWWTIRRYGKKEGRLTIREPSLEMKNLVDLTPFLEDYAGLSSRVEDLVGSELGSVERCGRDHHRCGSTPISLTLVEAVHLTHRLNTDLSSQERLKTIDRAVAVAKRERETAQRVEEEGEYCLSDAGTVCPLWFEERCLLFSARPLQCKSFELPTDLKAELWEEVLSPALNQLSRQLFFAFASLFPPGSGLAFSLPDVASGKYVERFFHLLLKSEAGQSDQHGAQP